MFLFPRTVIYDSNDEDVSTAPIYNYLIDGNYGLDILIYSGDDDSVCATIGSQEWVNIFFLKFDLLFQHLNFFIFFNF